MPKENPQFIRKLNPIEEAPANMQARMQTAGEFKDNFQKARRRYRALDPDDMFILDQMALGGMAIVPN